jgi:hypothetical protein
MPIVSRKDINSAKRVYRGIHHRLKEFDFGSYSFETHFLEMRMPERSKYYYEKDKEFELSELAASRIRILLKIPTDNVLILLRVSNIRHKTKVDECQTMNT